MRPPFPGMDPWLEHPAIWPDVHNSLITAIRDELAPRLAPRYSVGVEQRVYLLVPGEPDFVGRPDVAVVGRSDRVGYREPAGREEAAAVGVIDVEVPVLDELEEWFLEVRDVETRSLVTAIEILSPTNKIHPRGRKQYMRKRRTLLQSESSLVEIDLLRGRADAAESQQVAHRLSDPRQPRSDASPGQALHLQCPPADPADPDPPAAGGRRARAGPGGHPARPL